MSTTVVCFQQIFTLFPLLNAMQVEHALTLVAHDAIVVEKVRKGKMIKKSLKLPVTLDISTGKESTRYVAFSYVGWGDQTAKYLISINKSLNNIDMDHLLSEAKEYSWASVCHLYELRAGGLADTEMSQYSRGLQNE